MTPERAREVISTMSIDDLWPLQFCSSEEVREWAKLRIAQKVLTEKEATHDTERKDG